MNCIVYVSAACGLPSAEVLSDILNTSRRNNADHGITGLLLYVGGNFMQAIEGPETETAALLARIAADPRHRGLRVIAAFPIEQRYFPDWAMGWREASRLASEDRASLSPFFDEIDADRTSPSERTALARLLLERFAKTTW